MNAKILAGLTALVIAAAPFAAQAGEVHNRLSDQQARINQGVASGQLTRREYNNVESRDASINAQRERDLRKGNGHLTPQQYANLNRRENNVSRSIYYDKHNVSHQPGAPRI